MFFTKLFNGMFKNVDRRCAKNRLDLKTAARVKRQHRTKKLKTIKT